MQSGRREAEVTVHMPILAPSPNIRFLMWLVSFGRLTISCCSCICAIFLVYFWSTCFSSPTTPSQRSLKAFLSLISCRNTEHISGCRGSVGEKLEAAGIRLYLINEREVSLDGGLVLFLLELEVPVQLLLGLLHMSHRQLSLLGLTDRGGHEDDKRT